MHRPGHLREAAFEVAQDTGRETTLALRPALADLIDAGIVRVEWRMFYNDEGDLGFVVATYSEWLARSTAG